MLILTLAALCVGAASCSDDDPVKPQGFAVTINVVDTTGNPVEGLRVLLLNDTPYMQDGFMGSKAVTVMRFDVPQEAKVRFTIEDVEGREIRTLLNDELVAGSHAVVWNGLDSAGVHQHSGRYTAHMVATQLGTGTWMFEDRTDMLLAILDADRDPAGYTDAQGRLVLTDKTRFPHLYDLPDMTATDENGQPMGKITLTPLMRISIGDESGRLGMHFKKEIIEGTVLNLVWAPTLPEPAPEIGFTPALIDTTNPELQAGFKLYPVSPNPFN